ncbi:ABC transporter ATP-binding protein [Solwaraspora sp. WMMD1047]|uniref:ABC transporter ATP-binding protein n=1 Tax=Solwaraspora sp. WMMD1047 TaxID=3016102 RepID=UPI00241709AF|nr:ABC transporter ATP-binding protein [Solwaraspora sp. WMMD1047]MDG4830722.1 ABC transporter ATP-binding protein [Solwaraspora sp. WMMD1047]
MIEVENLSYGYRPDREAAVRDVSFTVGAGEILGFLGPSGAGKSTTQKVLTGLLSPYQGEVRVLGRDLRGQGPEYYQQIGVGFELPNHFMKLTGLENLRFFASFYAETADPRELLAMVGLADAADQRVEQYSKGMKMRLSFVRALLHDPDVLFLDEPTSGLDPVNARLLKDIIIEQRRRGKCVFLTTHNMHDAEELCDRVAFLVDGEIRRIGAPGELRTAGGPRGVLVEYRQDGQTRSAQFPLDRLGHEAAFLDILRDHEVVSLHSQEPTLEDVFVETTGRRLT